MANPTTTTIYGRNGIEDRPIRHNVQGKSDKVYGLNFPMGKRLQGGYLAKESGVELVKNNLKQLLLTSPGERVMLPRFGCNLKRYVFEPMDQTTFENIKKDILTSINRYARGVIVTKLQVIPGRSTAAVGSHVLSVKLFCKIREIENVNFDVTVELF